MNRWEKWYASASSPARCCDIVASLAKESSWGNIAMTSVSEGYARRDCCEVYVVRLANFLSSHTVILFFSLNEEATHVFVSFWLDQEFGNSEPCRDLSEWSGVKSHPICNHRYILNFHSFLASTCDTQIARSAFCSTRSSLIAWLKWKKWRENAIPLRSIRIRARWTLLFKVTTSMFFHTNHIDAILAHHSCQLATLTPRPIHILLVRSESWTITDILPRRSVILPHSLCH